MYSISHKELIRRSAQWFNEKTAIIYEGQSLTFQQVDERANRLANALINLGLRAKDRVATLMQNCLEYPEIEFALVKGSLVQVTLNPRLTAAEQLFQLDETDTYALIVQHHYLDLLKPIKKKLKKIKHFICFDGTDSEMLDYNKLISSSNPIEPEGELDPDDIGEIRYTSGTTGKPKGVMLPYRSHLAIARNLLMEHLNNLNCEDRFLALQPLYHGAGWFTLPVYLKGATHFIVPRFDADIALNIIQKERITFIKTVPTVLIRITDYPQIKSYDLSSIRTVIYGGSAMPLEKLKQAKSIFGDVFANIYGQLEAAMTITWLPKEENVGQRIGSVGRPCIFVQVKLVNERGEEVKPGEIGEVIIKGDHQMIGYLNRPDATAGAIRNGWLYTNDLGTVDKDGYIFLTGGRKSNMIKSGGLVVYPAEVEEVLYKHPAVKEVGVIGVPDPLWVEAVKACVVLKENYQVTEGELIKFCKEHLANYKSPKTIDFLKELPHTAAGKIKYAELIELYNKS